MLTSQPAAACTRAHLHDRLQCPPIPRAASAAELIRHLPLAKDVVLSARQELVMRLDGYCEASYELFAEVCVLMLAACLTGSRLMPKATQLSHTLDRIVMSGYKQHHCHGHVCLSAIASCHAHIHTPYSVPLHCSLHMRAIALLSCAAARRR